jgi:hypothetical protein
MLAFIILFFLSIFLLDIFYLSHRVSNVSQEEAKKTTLIYQGQEQRISFISRFDNVNLIYVRLKNPERKNTDDFYFQIKDQSNNILRQIDISGRNISDDDWIRFQFLPIKNIKDQKLNLSLNSATLDQNKAILVFTDNSDQLVYKVYSTDSWINVLRRELVNFYQRFTTDSLFVVSYIIINISIIIGYLILKKV